MRLAWSGNEHVGCLYLRYNAVDAIHTNLFSTKRNAADSPLLRLPVELRARIFSMVPVYFLDGEDDAEDPQRPSAGLLQTCRQTYQEASIYCEQECVLPNLGFTLVALLG